MPVAARSRTIQNRGRKINSIWQNDFVIAHTQILARSLKHWTGRDLLPRNFSAPEFAEKIFRAPFVLVSHGTEADPVLNYGNAAALALWEGIDAHAVAAHRRGTESASAGKVIEDRHSTRLH